MKRTLKRNKRQRSIVHGFRNRSVTVLKSRRAKGRATLSA